MSPILSISATPSPHLVAPVSFQQKLRDLINRVCEFVQSCFRTIFCCRKSTPIPPQPSRPPILIAAPPPAAVAQPRQQVPPPAPPVQVVEPLVPPQPPAAAQPQPEAFLAAPPFLQQRPSIDASLAAAAANGHRSIGRPLAQIAEGVQDPATAEGALVTYEVLTALLNAPRTPDAAFVSDRLTQGKFVYTTDRALFSNTPDLFFPYLFNPHSHFGPINISPDPDEFVFSVSGSLGRMMDEFQELSESRPGKPTTALLSHGLKTYGLWSHNGQIWIVDPYDLHSHVGMVIQAASNEQECLNYLASESPEGWTLRPFEQRARRRQNLGHL